MRHLSAILLLLAAAPATAADAATAPFCILSVQETPGSLAIITPDGKIVRRLPLGERPHEIAVAADGRTAYVSMFGIADYDNRIGTPGNSIARIDLKSATRTGDYVLPAPAKGPHGVKLRPPNNTELFANAESGGDTMHVFDTGSRRLKRSFAMPAATHNFVFSNDGAAIFSFAGARGVTKLDATTGRILASRDLGSPARGVFVTRSGTILASLKGALVELDADNLAEIRRLPMPRPGQFVYIDQHRDGTIAAPSLNDGGVALVPPVGAPLAGPARFIATGKTPIFARYGPDNRLYVANVEDDHISVINADGTPAAPITGLLTPNGIGFGDCPTP